MLEDGQKKSEKLEVRLPHETKQTFLAACRAQGQNASEVLRGFITAYIQRQADAGHETAEDLRQLLRRVWKIPAAVLATLSATLTLAIFGLTPSGAQSSAEKQFQRLDSDADGAVAAVEFQDNYMPVANDRARRISDNRFSAMDADGDGVISREEYIAFWTGDMTGIFNSLDADADGVLTLDEAVSATGSGEAFLFGLANGASIAKGQGMLNVDKDQPVFFQPGNAARLGQAFTLLDRDADGRVTLAEFLS